MRLSAAESNNLCYLIGKFVWDRQLTNEEIDIVLMQLPESPTPGDVIVTMGQHMQHTVGKPSDQQVKLKMQKAEEVVALFLRQSEQLRNDLGEDANYELLVTKH